MKKKDDDVLRVTTTTSYSVCNHEGEWITKGFWIFKRHYLRCKNCGKDIRDKYIQI